MMDRELIKIAYHEAGHAVMSVLHGQPVLAVDVHRVERRSGIMVSQVYRYQSNPTTTGALISFFEIALAGPIAQGIFERGYPGAIGEIRRADSPHWLEGSMWGGKNDFEVIRPYAATMWPEAAWRAQQVNSLAFETVSKLVHPNVWQAVDDIADALQLAGEVDQWEIERLASGLNR
jgi:hypothetical protein